MSVLFDEVDDYFSDSSPSGTVAADTDWSVGIWARLANNDGSATQVAVDTGFGTNLTYRLQHREDSASFPAARWEFQLDTTTGSATLTAGPGTPSDDGVWRLIVVTLTDSDQTLRMYYCDVDSAAVLMDSSVSAAFDNGLTPQTLDIGRRQDGDANSFWGGELAEFFQLNGVALSTAQIEALARGRTLYDIGVTPQIYVPMYTSESTLVDIAGSNALGRTSFPSNAEHPPIQFEDTALSVVPSAAGASSITPTGIASAEAFGSSQANPSAVATAIPSAEAFGSAGVDVSLPVVAIATAEAFGTASVDVSLAPSSVASAEAFGTAAFDPSVANTGIGSEEAFGSPSLGGAVTLTPGSIASAEAFGATSLDPTLGVNGIATSEGFGAPNVSPTLSPSSLASAEAFGVALVDVVLDTTSVASAEAFGSHAVTAQGTVAPIGISSAEQFGAAIIDCALDPTSIASAEAFGSALTAVTLTTSGIASAEGFGAPTIAVGVDPSSILGAEAFGTVVIFPTLRATSVLSAEAFGAAIVGAVHRFLVADAVSIEPRVTATVLIEPRITATVEINREVVGMKLYKDNDNIFRVTALKDNGVTPATFLNAASVTIRVLNRTTGAEIIAAITLDAVAGDNGNYEKVVDKALFSSLVLGTRYTVEWKAEETGADWELLGFADFEERPV